MKKGAVNALEIIFGVFLLLIVVFAIVKMITKVVTPEKISGQMQNFEDAYHFSQELESCKNLCEDYNTNNCNINDAVDYCLKKVEIDIDGNKIPAQKGHGNFVRNLPYCEDGLYCFHITDCQCGSYRLDASNCLQILCDYYVYEEGIDPKDAIKLIVNKDGIDWGSCNPKTTTWNLGYVPPTNLRADWWFREAGYYSLKCTNIQPGLIGITFRDCRYSNGRVTCDTSCSEVDEAFFIYKGEYIGATTSISTSETGNTVTVTPKTSNILNNKCTSQPNPFTVVVFCKDPAGYGTEELDC